MQTNKIALGTVQFGLNYGVANESGQVSVPTATHILKLAKEAKIDLLDTAIAYGDSEKVLGQIGVAGFKVVTKLPAVPNSCSNIRGWVEDEVHGSIIRLGVQSLYGILLHRSENLLGNSGKKIIDALNNLKLNGLLLKLGVSIYDPSELEQVMHLMNIDLVQAPLNIIDRRLETSGWLSNLHKNGVEVHSRSSFLQGLLLMARNKIPTKFDRWASMWDLWSKELEKHQQNAAAVCLAYPLFLPEVDRVVVGVDSADQLKRLIEASQVKPPQNDWSFMISDDPRLINPSNWSTL